MKHSLTAALGIALMAGVAGAALAQTTNTNNSQTPTATTPGTTSSSSQTPSGTTSGTTQSQSSLNQANPNAPSSGTQNTAPTGSQSSIGQANPNMPSTTGMPGTAPAARSQANRGQPGGQMASPDQVRQVQQQLASQGLHNGSADGVMDPDTRAAIAKFQQQNGLKRTERLDQATLDRLTRNQTMGSGSSNPSAPRPSTTPSSAQPSAAGSSNTPGGQPTTR